MIKPTDVKVGNVLRIVADKTWYTKSTYKIIKVIMIKLDTFIADIEWSDGRSYAPMLSYGGRYENFELVNNPPSPVTTVPSKSCFCSFFYGFCKCAK